MENFYVTEEVDLHVIRRKQILEKYPEIQNLFGNDVRPFPFIVVLVLIQLYMASIAPTLSAPVFALAVVVVGTTCCHSLTLAGHEASHNLVFATTRANEYLGIFCNLGMGIPSSNMFKRYHMEHHLFMGKFLVDVDLPTFLEGKLICNMFTKLIFLVFQPLFYAVRPMLIRPKVLNNTDLLNYAVVIGMDLAWLFFGGGVWSVVYLIASTLCMGLNPIAGHFISEHYLMIDDTTTPDAVAAHKMVTQETYSYYGALNYLTWNVGYHNEHHDFPRVPGFLLPQVRAIAKEFYDPLPSHSSWSLVLWQFVTNPRISCFNRVIRRSASSKND